MPGRYQLWLTDDKGARIATLNGAKEFSASRVANGIGQLSMTLPATFDINLIDAPDRMVQVWRAPRGSSAKKLWRPYFVRWFEYQTQSNREFLIIGGPDVNDLLRRRIVAAFSGSAQATKFDVADDVMKEIVTESIADGIDPAPDEGTRVWADLSIQGDAGAGPIIRKAFAFKKLLTPQGGGVLPAIAKAAREEGTEVFFDIRVKTVSSSAITFEFQTFIGQPGPDVSDRVLFSREKGTLKNATYRKDRSQEVNYVYAGGQQPGAARNVQQVADSTRYLESQWNRCEGFADARNQASDDSVTAAGNALLERGRPIERAGGTPVDTRSTRFGRDWDFGYKVGFKYRNIEFDAIVRALTLTVKGRRETIGTRLDAER